MLWHIPGLKKNPNTSCGFIIVSSFNGQRWPLITLTLRNNKLFLFYWILTLCIGVFSLFSCHVLLKFSFIFVSSFIISYFVTLLYPKHLKFGRLFLKFYLLLVQPYHYHPYLPWSVSRYKLFQLNVVYHLRVIYSSTRRHIKLSGPVSWHIAACSRIW